MKCKKLKKCKKSKCNIYLCVPPNCFEGNISSVQSTDLLDHTHVVTMGYKGRLYERIGAFVLLHALAWAVLLRGIIDITRFTETTTNKKQSNG